MKTGLLWIFFATLSLPLLSQDEMVFTRGFTKKLKRLGLEFLYPAEEWLKPARKKRDPFMKYDLVLHGQNYEMRLFTVEEPKKRSLHPHVKIMAILSSIATNDENAFILMEPLSKHEAHDEYGADWAAIAHFRPKSSFSSYSHGQMLAMYKEDTGLVLCISLFEKTDPYFKKAIRFLPEG